MERFWAAWSQPSGHSPRAGSLRLSREIRSVLGPGTRSLTSGFGETPSSRHRLIGRASSPSRSPHLAFLFVYWGSPVYLHPSATQGRATDLSPERAQPTALTQLLCSRRCPHPPQGPLGVDTLGMGAYKRRPRRRGRVPVYRVLPPPQSCLGWEIRAGQCQVTGLQAERVSDTSRLRHLGWAYVPSV